MDRWGHRTRQQLAEHKDDLRNLKEEVKDWRIKAQAEQTDNLDEADDLVDSPKVMSEASVSLISMLSYLVVTLPASRGNAIMYGL